MERINMSMGVGLRLGNLRQGLTPATSFSIARRIRNDIEAMQARIVVTSIIEQLQRDEGLVLTTYIDSTGHMTIGWGHNLSANPIAGIGSGSMISITQALDILLTDINATYQRLVQAAPWVAIFNPTALQVTRRGVLLNMAFNLGVPGLMTFTNTLAAIRAHDYATAAADMANSLWASQVGARATRLEQQIQLGTWQ